MAMSSTTTEIDEVWWFICTVCNRAHTTHIQLLLHKRTVHNSKGGTADTLILSQKFDLQPKVEISCCIGRARRVGESKRATTTNRRNRKIRRGSHQEVDIKDEGSSRTTSNGSNSLACAVCSYSFQTVERLETHNFLLHPTRPRRPRHGSSLDSTQASPQSSNCISDCVPVNVKQENADARQEDDNMDHKDDGHIGDDPAYDGAQSEDGVSLGLSGSDSDWEESRPKPKRHNETNMKTVADKKKVYSCQLCSQEFKLKRDLRTHDGKVHTAEADRTCDVCSKVYSTRKYLRIHKRDFHAGLPGPVCSSCGRVFKSARQLSSHTKYHHTNEVHVCQVCNYSTFHPPHLEKHKLTHGPPSFKCTVCGVMLRNKRNLREHSINKHSHQRPFKCQKCPIAFKTNQRLGRHSKMVHPEGGPHSCEICSRSFKTTTHLKRHTRFTHQKAHICRVCGQEFPGRTSLMRHEIGAHNFHRAEPKYKCEECGKCFIHKFNLDYHLASHGNLKHVGLLNPDLQVVKLVAARLKGGWTGTGDLTQK